MTCKDCEIAGYIAEELERLGADDPAVPAVRAMAERWHRKCEEDACACAHIV